MFPEEYPFHVVGRFVISGHRYSVASRIYENQHKATLGFRPYTFALTCICLTLTLYALRLTPYALCLTPYALCFTLRA
jgi:hypothetical protein